MRFTRRSSLTKTFYGEHHAEADYNSGQLQDARDVSLSLSAEHLEHHHIEQSSCCYSCNTQLTLF